jgi:hypothetical protein
MAADKDTIYIDIDDEITGIIDKLKGSDKKVVALVLPKRASVFQSIVNMKLLKRAADSSNKNLVLITSEAGLLPLAGSAGIHVAKTLTTKPEIPADPGIDSDNDAETIDENGAESPVDSSQPVGDLADAAAGVETLVLDDEDTPPEDAEGDAKPAAAAAGAGAAAGAAAKKAKNKKFKIPDFNRFRLWLTLGVLALVILVGGLIFAAVALPKATIAIKTNASNIDTSTEVNLSTAATKLSSSDNTVPAKLAQQQKTYTQQVPTTGQKNNGNKSSGHVTVTNCNDSTVTIPAGTGFKSSAGNTYISEEAVDVPGSDFSSPLSGGKCKNNGKASVAVMAQNGGTAYNQPSGASFTVAYGSNLSGQGGTMAGGTDSIVQTVNQNDINNAKSKIAANDNEIKTALSDQLKKDGYLPIMATYNAGTPVVTASANVGDVATTVTVTQANTSTMFGAHKEDLQTLVENSIKDQIDTGKQSILDTGLDKGIFTLNGMSATAAQLGLVTRAAVGPDLDPNAIKANAAGKKPGAVKEDLKSNPDVTDVEVKLSPFWVSSVPKKTDRVKVDIAKPATNIKSTNTDANNP